MTQNKLVSLTLATKLLSRLIVLIKLSITKLTLNSYLTNALAYGVITLKYETSILKAIVKNAVDYNYSNSNSNSRCSDLKDFMEDKQEDEDNNNLYIRYRDSFKQNRAQGYNIIEEELREKDYWVEIKELDFYYCT